jgi:large subunit ribosomal protein L27e
MKPIDEGKKKRKFGHCLVVGVEKPPRKISKKMNQKKLTRKARVKPFVKYVNNTHLLATRFMVKDDEALDFKNTVSEEALEKPDTRKAMIKSLKASMEQR